MCGLQEDGFWNETCDGRGASCKNLKVYAEQCKEIVVCKYPRGPAGYEGNILLGAKLDESQET